MERSSKEPSLSSGRRPRAAGRAHLIVLLVLQTVLTAELALLAVSGRWMHVFLVIAVMAVILVPELVRRQLKVEIPSEMQIAAALFVFAALFLGEVRDFYERIWWWDQALHASAGLLAGLLGFLIVYSLNARRDVELQMRPAFVALFAFAFSLSIGTVWEVFEFVMDQSFGLTMQKPMLGDPSGLTDTMWDLILDGLGAAAVSIGGWRYMRLSRRRHVDTWVARLIRRHKRMVRQSSAGSGNRAER